ncbi:sensor histidine kinase [Paenibacillus septentrionalis]|uniref:Heme sensor protein HssS n=1 Tax=Paenibacillus septentrionalis TaxID=429342 RepID=A0ABW1V4N1_9BACL
MIKTLYIRIIVYYMAAVLIGVVVAWLSALYIFKESAEQAVSAELTAKADHMLQLYRQANPENANMLLEHAARLASVGIQLKKESSQETLYMNWPDDEERCNCDITIQQQWEFNGETYTIELIESRTDASSGRYEIALVLLIVLAIGSLIVLLFARLLVKPIHQVTSAAKQWAGGDFNVKIPENGPDEIGVLSKTLNEMADDLAKLERERQEFVANVSHEFQSPLTVIKGFSAVLLEGELDESQRKRSAQIIMKESERLSKLSDNLLRLASLESDSVVLSPSSYDLSEQIRRTVLSFEPLWSGKQLDVEMNAKPITICADRELLNQVWYNLMSNAIKFTPNGGRIIIDVLIEAGRINVQFFDNGTSISTEDREKIFERFFKVDRARDRSIDGNGLGLFIVQKIVAIHKGTIDIEEKKDGKAFIVSLPQSRQSIG